MRDLLSAGTAGPAVFAAIALGCAGTAQAQQPSPVTLEGADRDTLSAIHATLPEREAPETLFDAERLAEEAAGRAETWMRSEGYYAGTAMPVAEDNPPRARVKISLGDRFIFAAPTVSYGDSRPDAAVDAAARDALKAVRPGAPARAEDVLAAETAAVLVLQDRGYAEAKAAPRTAIVDHATGKMNVAFAFDLGPQVRLGHVRVSPAGVVKTDYVEKLKPWSPGDLYSPTDLVDLRRDLTSTGAFSRVQVRLAPAPEANGERDVIVRLNAAKPHTIALGASYSTTDGPGVDAEWTRRNIYGRADSLTVSGTLAEQGQKVSVELFRPHAAGPGRGRRYAVVVERENVSPYERAGVTLSAAVESQADVKFATSYGVSLAANAYSQSAGIDNAIILSTFYSVRADRSDEKLDPRSGGVLEGRVEPAVSFGDESTAFIRATAGAKGYYTPGKQDRVTLAARLNVGWVQPVLGTADDLPLDKRFYAGGGGSVRGYEYRSIYPTATIVTTEPPGGQGLLETSLEARYRTGGKFGAAAFVDGGAAFNDFGEATDLHWGAGVGVRYNLGFAPLRFDVAVPLDKREGDPDVAFYVSLGQAF
jgi:translocation and assembly module TamA